MMQHNLDDYVHCWGARIRTWECPAERDVLPLDYIPIIFLKIEFPFRLFKYFSLAIASLRVAYFSGYTSISGTRDFVDRTFPSLCLRRRDMRLFVCPI